MSIKEKINVIENLKKSKVFRILDGNGDRKGKWYLERTYRGSFIVFYNGMFWGNCKFEMEDEMILYCYYRDSEVQRIVWFDMIEFLEEELPF